MIDKNGAFVELKDWVKIYSASTRGCKHHTFDPPQYNQLRDNFGVSCIFLDNILYYNVVMEKLTTTEEIMLAMLQY